MKKITIVLVIACFFLMSSSLSQTLISDPPASNNITNYCAGQTGVQLGVNNATLGINYILERSLNGSTNWTNHANVTATASPAWFPNAYNVGYYRLEGTTSPVIQVVERQLPAKYNVYGGGGFCPGTTQWFDIAIDNTTVGIAYQVLRNGNPFGPLVNGTGSGLLLGNFSLEGTYTVRATNQWGCPNLMNGEAFIVQFENPTANFNAEPQNECSLIPVIFTPTVTNGTPPYTYYWDFTGNGSYTSIEENPSFVFPAYGNGSQTFSVTLVASDANQCSHTVTQNVAVTQRPHAGLIGSGFPEFTNCDPEPSAIFSLTVSNNSSTQATNQNYWIDWYGEGNFIELGVGFTTTQHTYTTKGSFPLTFRVEGLNGCFDEQIYNVFNGSTPEYGLANSELVGCAPLEVIFTLPAAVYSNTPGTYYYFDFGDGTTKDYYQHELPAAAGNGTCAIIHTYEYSSCFLNHSHSYSMSTYVKNPCDSIPYTLGGIKISKAPVSSFDLIDFPPPGSIYLCKGMPHQFTNYTTKGCLIIGSQVNDITSYHWDFGDFVGTSNKENPTYTYTTEGLYNVSLIAHTAEGFTGNCGAHESIRTVCVQDMPTAEFTIPDNTDCDEFEFTPNNSSFAVECADLRYRWFVEESGEPISPGEGFVYTSGGQNSKEPTFKFTKGGEYTLVLVARVLSAGVLCFSDTTSVSFIITNVPEVTANVTALELCGPGSVAFNEEMIQYNSNFSDIISYNWNVIPPVPAFDNIQFPIISFDDYGVYTITMYAANTCGNSDEVTITVKVNNEIENNVIHYNPDSLLICAGMFISEITGTGIEDLTGGDESSFDFQWYVLWPGSPDTIFLFIGANLPPQQLNLIGNTKFQRIVQSGSCISYSNTIEFTVVEGITNNKITTQPYPVCKDTTPGYTLNATMPVGGGDDHEFLWEQSTDLISWVVADGEDVTVQNFNPNLPLSVTTHYRRRVSTDACYHYSDYVTIFVNDYPVVNPINHEPICSGDNFSQAITANIANSIFNWEITNTVGSVSGNPGSGNQTINIETILSNTGKAGGIVTFTLSPYGPEPTLCAGEPYTFDLIVLPVAVITNAETEQSIGSEEWSDEVIFNNDIEDPDLDVTYIWSGTPSHAAMKGWQTSGSDNLPSMQIYIDPDVPGYPSIGFVEYLVLPRVNGCDGQPFIYTIHVLLYPVTYFLTVDIPEFCFDGVSCASIELNGSQTGVTYRLFKNGIYQPQYDEPGTGSAIPWCVQTGGEYTVNALNNTTGASIDMEGSVEVLSRPLPLQYFLNVLQPDDQCVPIIPMLYNSQSIAKYHLILNGDEENPVQVIEGTGDFIIFDERTEHGVYTVHARIYYDEIFCERLMYGSLTANPLPQEFQVSPLGPFCESDDVEICIDNSEEGINYRLWINNQAVGAIVPGNGGVLCFGGLNGSGIYRIHARNPGTGCDIFFSDEILVNPSPIKFNVNPAKACPGVSIELTECQEGLTYYLIFEAAKGGTPEDMIVDQITCQQQGQPIVFPPQFEEGIYKIMAVNEHECPKWMEGSTTILPLPDMQEITPGSGKYCMYDNLTIGLENSDVGFVYELHRLNAIDNPQFAVEGTGGPFDFPGPLTRAGIYRVKAVSEQLCERWMEGSVTLSNPPLKYNLLANGFLPQAGWFCPPAVISLQASEPGVEYSLYCDGEFKNMIDGTGVSINFGEQYEPGIYTINAYNPATRCSAEMNNFIGLYEAPEQFNLLSSHEPPYFCAGSTSGIDLILNQSQPGVLYRLFKGSQPLPQEFAGDENGGPIIWENVSQYGAGSYHAVGRFPDDQQCEAVMNGVVSIQEIQAPEASFFQGQEFCLYEPCIDLALSIVAELPVAVTYSDGLQQYIQSFHPGNNPYIIRVCPDETTSYHLVAIEYIDLGGCFGNVSGTGVELFKIPEVEFTYYQENNCSGWIQFEDRSSGYNTSVTERLWTFKHGYHSTLKYPKHEFETTGNHSVLLRVKDQRGCWNEKTETVYVGEFFDFGILASEACFNEPISFSIDPISIKPDGNSLINYQWSFGDGSPYRFTSSPSHIYSLPGNFEVTLQAEDHTGCIKTNTKTISVPQPLEPDFSFIDCSMSVEFHDETYLNSGDIVTWEWNFGDDNKAIVNAPELPIVTHVYSVSGNFEVTLTVTDVHGCSENSVVKSVRTDCYDIVRFYVPNAFAPDHTNEEVKVFKPKGVNIKDYHIEVFDLWGNLLWESMALDEEGSPAESWDGTYKGKPLQQGAFIWRAFVKFRDGTIWYLNEKEDIRTGTVTLIR